MSKQVQPDENGMLNPTDAAFYLRSKRVFTTAKKLQGFAPFNGPVCITTELGPKYPIASLDAYVYRTIAARTWLSARLKHFEIARVLAGLS